MNNHDATEQAYKNGYEAGYKAAEDDFFVNGVLKITKEMLAALHEEQEGVK